MQKSFLQPSYGATKVQGTRLPVISFIFAWQSPVFVKLYLYMSGYICQFSKIVYIPDLLLLRIRYHWVLSQNITEETSYLLWSGWDYEKHEQKWKQVTLDKNITVTAVMGAQRSSFEPHGKHQVRKPPSTFRLCLVLCNGFQWRNNSPYFILQWRNNRPYC